MTTTAVELNVEAKIDVRDRHYNHKLSEYNGRARIYFHHDEEDMLENFGNRVARPVDLYRSFLPQIAEAMGLPTNTKFRWSQKAGCRCGCSPGFICDGVTRKDVFVTLRGAPKTNNDPKQLAQANNRVGQLVGQLSAEKRFADDVEYREQLETFLSR